MIIAETAAGLREHISNWRAERLVIGFVPTMGNLHAGHLALVDEAAKHADRIVVSIFVNPAQFGPDEDFESYPRTLEADRDRLSGHAVDLVFQPSVEEMYGNDPDDGFRIRVPEDISGILCGASRHGHFEGVATVVAKLFNQVTPDIAVFGEKDFQQLMVIRQMVDGLAFPVEIISLPTQREADGLAMSSRNLYLTETERGIAPKMYTRLQQVASAVRAGNHDYAALCAAASEQLAKDGFLPEYVEIRQLNDLKIPEDTRKELIVLAAAYLGKARLIDNMRIELGERWNTMGPLKIKE